VALDFVASRLTAAQEEYLTPAEVELMAAARNSGRHSLRLALERK
jgi:hypothetical protein